MENATINWARHFVRAYCIHYLPQAQKLPRLMAEFRRIWFRERSDGGILDMHYTNSTQRRFDECIMHHAGV